MKFIEFAKMQNTKYNKILLNPIFFRNFVFLNRSDVQKVR